MKKTELVELLEGRKPFIVSDGFHRATKIISFAEKIDFYYPLLWQKISYKAYPRLEKRELPAPLVLDHKLGKVILNRRSEREFSGKPLCTKELSTLLFYSCGVSKKNKDWNQALRVYPSAGAKFPIEVYIIGNKVNGMNGGLYHYNVKGHYLEALLKKPLIDFAVKVTGQDWVAKTAIVFILLAANTPPFQGRR